MKIKLLLLSLAILSLVGFKSKRSILPQATPLEQYVDSLFKASMDSTRIAGGAVLVAQKGEVLLNKAYGYASLELGVPMPADGQFEIGSVTKQFTAAAIMKLVEDKKMALTDDFTKYLDFDTKGRTITINNLLNHTSGIASYTELPEFWDLSIEEHPRDSLVRLVEQNDFLFEPNTALIYNNSAYFFLGLIIEKVSGQSYEAFLQDTFFEPLGMNNTYYCSTTRVVSNKVYGYNYTPGGLQQKPYLNHLWPYAAGSLCSSVEDLYTWMKALHSGKVLTKSSYQSLITPDQLEDGSKLSYAKGLLNYTNFGHKEISHGGGIHGFLSDSRYYPEHDLYIICLVNTTGPNGGGFFADKITWQFLDKKEYESVKLDIDTKALEGKYNGQIRGRTLAVEVKSIPDGLTIQNEGEDQIDTLKIYIGDHTWMDDNAQITFKHDECRIDQAYGYYILRKVD